MPDEDEVEQELEETRDQIKGMIEAMEANEETKKVAEETENKEKASEEEKDVEEVEPVREVPDEEPYPEEESSEMDSERDSKEEEAERSEEGKFIDPETGKEFDTASGLKLYQKYVKK